MIWDPENLSGSRTMLFQSLFHTSDEDWPSFGYFTAVRATGDGIPIVVTSGLDPPQAEVYYGTFGWCAQTFYNVTASPSGLVPGTVTSERLTQRDILTIPGPDNAMNTYYFTYVANSTGSTYNISRMVTNSLPGYLRTLLTTTVYDNKSRPVNTDGQLLQLGFALYKSDLSNVTLNIADTLSNQIRSNNPTGDNFNVSTSPGTAFFNETYMRVRWPWLILPLAETALGAILLVITIVITRQQPLLKTSVIAYLTSGLEGWTEDDLDVARPRNVTQEKLEDLAEGMRARLEEDVGGRLRFRRHYKMGS
jgi:hypothetical protein